MVLILIQFLKLKCTKILYCKSTFVITQTNIIFNVMVQDLIIFSLKRALPMSICIKNNVIQFANFPLELFTTLTQ